MFKRIKCITNRHPRFLKEVYKHDVLIDLQNDERFIKRGEPFIRWDDGAWDLWRMADPKQMIFEILDDEKLRNHMIEGHKRIAKEMNAQ